MFFVLFVTAIVIIVFYKFQEINLYWNKLGIPYLDPWPFVGNMLPFALGRTTVYSLVRDFYKSTSEKRYCGIYQFFQPILLINDIDLIKQICIKDFDHFIDHKSFFSESDDPVFKKNLFGSKGQEWRELRALLSPTFTGSKMRAMHMLINDCASRFSKHFIQKCKSQPMELDVNEIFHKFTIDTIGTCAFGIENDSVAHENNEFYMKGKKVASFGGLRALKCIGFLVMPKVLRFFNVQLYTKDNIDFFRDIVERTITHRERNNIIRPDLIHLMMEAKKGRLKFEETKEKEAGFASVEESESTKFWNMGNLTIDDQLIVAQALLFFIGGSDTISKMICFVCHELAVHPDIQQKLQAEIDEVFEKNNGKITYDVLFKMKYLDMVISETMRFWPIAFFIDRLCTKSYTIEAKEPGEKTFTIEEGTTVWIPVVGIHKNPLYYPNPDKFDPERFNDTNKDNIKPYTYLPFGLGPRSCIGNRFALLVAKTFLCNFLRYFELNVIKNTQIPLQLAKSEIVINAEKGFNLGISLRKHCA